MAPGLALLVGLVSALEEVTWVHTGSSFQPCIWAVPGAVLPLDASGSIFCRVPSGVTSLRLYHGVLREIWYDRDLDGAQDAQQFSLPKVTDNDAGIYSCGYWKQGTWSICSESLELVVTGVYRDQPSLTAHPAALVASGGNVTLWCQPVQRYDTYILCRGGGFLPQDCSRQNHSSFLISAGSLDQNETYTCYGSYDNPQLWSLPSHPLMLSVTRDFTLRQQKSSSWGISGNWVFSGSRASTCLWTRKQKDRAQRQELAFQVHSGSFSAQDYTTENIIRLSVGIFILFVLGALLLDVWKGRNGL